MGKEDQSENYKNALAAAEKLVKAQDKINKNAETSKAIWGDISSSIFGVSSADFFKEIPKTTEELKISADQAREIRKNLKEAGKSFNDDLFSSTDALKTASNAFKELSENSGQDLSKEFATITSKQKEAHKDWVKNNKERGDLSKEAFKELEETDALIEKMKDANEETDVIMKGINSSWVNIKKEHGDYLSNKLVEAMRQRDVATFLKEGGEDAQKIYNATMETNEGAVDLGANFSAIAVNARETTKALDSTKKSAFEVTLFHYKSVLLRV